MKNKLAYIIAGTVMTLLQLSLVGGRFNSVSIYFGVIAAIMYIKALTIRQPK